jgi:ribosomal protein S13
LKDDLKSGRATLGELLDKAAGNDTVGKMKVLAVLESLPGTGKVKARRLMEQVGISDTRRLQGLGAKQREQLLEAIERS